MPFSLVALHDTLLGLRDLVFPTRVAAAIFDAEYPGVLSGYAALVANGCWLIGELPLWAATQGGGLEQVAWRPGRFIEWPDTTRDIVITQAAGLLMGEGDPPVYRREIIATSAAGAERLQAFVRVEIPERMPDAVLKEWILAKEALSEAKLWKLAKQLGHRKPPKSQLRRVHVVVKRENKALQPTRGPRPKQ